jgi:hypothetical protein
VYDGVREIRRAVLMNRVSKILLLHAQSSWYNPDVSWVILDFTYSF